MWIMVLLSKYFEPYIFDIVAYEKRYNFLSYINFVGFRKYILKN